MELGGEDRGREEGTLLLYEVVCTRLGGMWDAMGWDGMGWSLTTLYAINFVHIVQDTADRQAGYALMAW